LPFQKKSGLENRYFYVVGVFKVIALVIFCFTQDSFPIPNTWINKSTLLGLGSMTARLD
jgi:hypothetical protein